MKRKKEYNDQKRFIINQLINLESNELYEIIRECKFRVVFELYCILKYDFKNIPKDNYINMED